MLLQGVLQHTLGTPVNGTEQAQYNLFYRWFIGLSIDNVVWVPTVFTKNRERLIKHDAVFEFFNEVLTIAEKKNWLSGEHFSVDGTLIQAWAGHKSFVRNDRDDQSGGDGNFKGSKSSNEPHQSTTDPNSRLYRKGNSTGSDLRYMGHTFRDKRHGLIANAMVTRADLYVERDAAKAKDSTMHANPWLIRHARSRSEPTRAMTRRSSCRRVRL